MNLTMVFCGILGLNPSSRKQKPPAILARTSEGHCATKPVIRMGPLARAFTRSPCYDHRRMVFSYHTYAIYFRHGYPYPKQYSSKALRYIDYIFSVIIHTILSGDHTSWLMKVRLKWLDQLWIPKGSYGDQPVHHCPLQRVHR
jgi:hypothetical protein